MTAIQEAAAWGLQGRLLKCQDCGCNT